MVRRNSGPRLGAALSALAFVSCLWAPRVQRAGAYAFTADRVLRDECHLLPTPLWGGTLRLAGHDIWLDSQLFGIQLSGQYRQDDESFYLDGTAAEVPTRVQGVACVVDVVNLHVDGTTDSPTRFHGALRVQYTTPAPEACVCQLWVTYHADRQP